MDGANLNALMGLTRPGDFGIDVMHMNLHKTMSTPHGGGGPGAGPVAIKKILVPYLPCPVVERNPQGKYFLDHDRPRSIGKVKAFYGNFGTLVRALCYILANGPEGLRETSSVAVLNANYIKHKLRDYYDLPYDEPVLHEVVFSNKKQAQQHHLRHGHCQATDGLWISSANCGIPAHCSRRLDDRAHRNRRKGRTRSFHRRDEGDCS